MGFIKDFFDFILNTVSTVWDFFTGIVEDLVLLVQYLSFACVMAFSAIATLPTWLKVFGSVSISVSVLYLLIGRTVGKGE